MICYKNYAFSNSNLFRQAKKINMHKTAVKGILSQNRFGNVHSFCLGSVPRVIKDCSTHSDFNCYVINQIRFIKKI